MFVKDVARPETGEKRNRRTKRCAAVSGCGVQLAFDVLHTGVFQDVDVFALAKLYKEMLESLASLREWP